MCGKASRCSDLRSAGLLFLLDWRRLLEADDERTVEQVQDITANFHCLQFALVVLIGRICHGFRGG